MGRDNHTLYNPSPVISHCIITRHITLHHHPSYHTASSPVISHCIITRHITLHHQEQTDRNKEDCLISQTHHHHSNISSPTYFDCQLSYTHHYHHSSTPSSPNRPTTIIIAASLLPPHTIRLPALTYPLSP